MIRNIFLIVGIISLVYSIIFLLLPYWFVNLTESDTTNIAWLRFIGSSLLGVFSFGSFAIYIKPGGKLGIIKMMTITSYIQALTLIYSRFYNEFSAKNIIVIDLTIYLAVFLCICLTWILYFKSSYFDKKFI